MLNAMQGSPLRIPNIEVKSPCSGVEEPWRIHAVCLSRSSSGSVEETQDLTGPFRADQSEGETQRERLFYSEEINSSVGVNAKPVSQENM